MDKKELVIVVDYAQDISLTMREIADICQLSDDEVQILMEYDIIRPSNNHMEHLQRVKIALRLQRDLEVNLAGAVLILDLLDEMEQLRSKTELFERHFIK